MLTRSRLRACLVPAAVIVLATAVGCAPKAPPIVAVGDPVIGVNPQVASTPGARTKVIDYGPWTV